MLGSMAVLRVDASSALRGFAGSGIATRFKPTRARTSRRTGARLTGTFSTQRRGGAPGKTIPNGMKALWNQSLRPFFGITAEERKALVAEAIRILNVR
jgi:hypothetical protein